MPNGLGRWRVAGYRMGSVTLALAACVAAGEALRAAAEAGLGVAFQSSWVVGPDVRPAGWFGCSWR